MASVLDTDYEYFAQDDFRVRKPDIKISLQGEPVSEQEIDVIVRLTNPLPIPLRKGLFQLEGPGIESQILLKVIVFCYFSFNRLIVYFKIRLLRYQFRVQHRPHLNIYHHMLAGQL